MNTKSCLLVFVLLFSFTLAKKGLSQASLQQYCLDMPDVDGKGVLIPIPETEEHILVLSSREAIHAFKLNPDYSLQKRVETRRNSKSPIKLWGSKFENNKLLLCIQEAKDEIVSVRFDFDQGGATRQSFGTPFDKQIDLGMVSDEDGWYFLRLKKSSSILKLHAFNADAEVNLLHQTYEYDVSREDINVTGRLSSLFMEKTAHVQSVPSNGPIQLNNVIWKYKLSLTPDELVFSFDNIKNKTNLFIVDRSTFKHSLKSIDQARVTRNPLKSNSYVNHNFLYQISLHKKSLALKVSDWKNEQLIMEKEFSFTEFSDEMDDAFYAVKESGKMGEIKGKTFASRLKNASTRLGILGKNVDGGFKISFGPVYTLPSYPQSLSSMLLADIFSRDASPVAYSVMYMDVDETFQKKQLSQPDPVIFISRQNTDAYLQEQKAQGHTPFWSNFFMTFDHKQSNMVLGYYYSLNKCFRLVLIPEESGSYVQARP